MNKTTLSLFFAALAIPALSSCQTRPAARRVPFNEADFAAYGRPGSASVSGKLVVRDTMGGIHSGNQSVIALLPVNAYTREAVQREVFEARHLVPPDPRFGKYRRAVKCDKAGNFRFNRVPAGEYFLLSLVQWEGIEDIPTFQWVSEQIKVSEGQALKITHPHNELKGGAGGRGIIFNEADDL